MNEQLYRELTAAARRMGLTDEIVGLLRPAFRAAYEAGRRDAIAKPPEADRVPKEKK